MSETMEQLLRTALIDFDRESYLVFLDLLEMTNMEAKRTLGSADNLFATLSLLSTITSVVEMTEERFPMPYRSNWSPYRTFTVFLMPGLRNRVGKGLDVNWLLCGNEQRDVFFSQKSDGIEVHFWQSRMISEIPGIVSLSGNSSGRTVWIRDVNGNINSTVDLRDDWGPELQNECQQVMLTEADAAYKVLDDLSFVLDRPWGK